MFTGLPSWLSGKASTSQHRRHRFNPWVRKICWRRKWQPTPVFLPGKAHGQRSLVGYSPWGHKRVRHDLATNQPTNMVWTLEKHQPRRKHDHGVEVGRGSGRQFNTNQHKDQKTSSEKSQRVTVLGCEAHIVLTTTTQLFASGKQPQTIHKWMGVAVSQ